MTSKSNENEKYSTEMAIKARIINLLEFVISEIV